MNFRAAGLVVLIAVLLAGGYAYWSLQKYQSSRTLISKRNSDNNRIVINPIPPSTTQHQSKSAPYTPASDWQTQTNKKYGFAVSFPSYMHPQDTYFPDDLLIMIADSQKGTPFEIDISKANRIESAPINSGDAQGVIDAVKKLQMQSTETQKITYQQKSIEGFDTVLVNLFGFYGDSGGDPISVLELYVITPKGLIRLSGQDTELTKQIFETLRKV